jgi:hypothetical protein
MQQYAEDDHLYEEVLQQYCSQLERLLLYEQNKPLVEWANSPIINLFIYSSACSIPQHGRWITNGVQ